MHDGYVERLHKTAFDLEALGSLDILKVDASECGGYAAHALDKLVGRRGVNLDIECVDAGHCLEKEAFALHYGLCRQGAYVAQTQNCRAVADDGH